MKIYKLENSTVYDYDTYDSCVVITKDEDEPTPDEQNDELRRLGF